MHDNLFTKKARSTNILSLTASYRKITTASILKDHLQRRHQVSTSYVLLRFSKEVLDCREWEKWTAVLQAESGSIYPGVPVNSSKKYGPVRVVRGPRIRLIQLLTVVSVICLVCKVVASVGDWQNGRHQASPRWIVVRPLT